MGLVRILQISDLHLTRLDEARRHEYLQSSYAKKLFSLAEEQYHSILRKILLNSSDSSILFRLTDWMVRNSDSYDLILITGDLADSGSENDMRLARAFVEGPVDLGVLANNATTIGTGQVPTIAAIQNKPIVLLPGNHDHFISEKLRLQYPSQKTHWYQSIGARYGWELDPNSRISEYRFSIGEGNLLTSYDENQESFAIVCADFAVDSSMDRVPLDVVGFLSQGRVGQQDLSELVTRTKSAQELMPVFWACHFAPEPLKPGQPIPGMLNLIDSANLEQVAKDFEIPAVFSGHTHQYLDLLSDQNHPNLVRAASAGCCVPELEQDAQTGVQVTTVEFLATGVEVSSKEIKYCEGCGFDMSCSGCLSNNK